MRVFGPAAAWPLPGEPPTAKGYPPSVYALLPRLLERAGGTPTGSITGIYTVLVEGDDLDEPLADAIRGFLDGHVWLSRGLANRGHYPAIDVLNSISRVAPDVTGPSQREAVVKVWRVLATWNDIEDLVSIGAYVAGANADYDVAVQTREVVNAYLVQGQETGYAFDEAVEALCELGKVIDQTRQAVAAGKGEVIQNGRLILRLPRHPNTPTSRPVIGRRRPERRPGPREADRNRERSPDRRNRLKRLSGRWCRYRRRSRW